MLTFYRFFLAPIIWILFKIGAVFVSPLKKRDSVIAAFDFSRFQVNSGKKILWIHSASMGEFEQAKPIIEYLRSVDQNKFTVLVTFFSPSGYEHQKNYSYADVCTYLPIDTFGAMKQFVQTVSPSVVVFIRYELWPNLLALLSSSSIPFYFVNATFPNSWFWASFGSTFLRSLLSTSTGVYAVNEKEFTKFSTQLGLKNVFLSHDTRIDRIVEKVHNHQAMQFYIPPKKLTLVVGSSWEREILLLATVSPNLLEQFHIIIVPHEPDSKTLSFVQQQFSNSVLLSQLQPDTEITTEIVIVDSIGKLLSIYSLATIAFVGGGFGRCVHSTVEALAYGIPVICGPNIAHSPDATTFAEIGLVSIVHSSQDIENILSKVLHDTKWLESIQSRSFSILEPSLGESKRIGDILREYLV